MDAEYKVTTDDMQLLTLCSNSRLGRTTKLTWPYTTILNICEGTDTTDWPTECDITVTANQAITLRFSSPSTLFCDWGDGVQNQIFDQSTTVANPFAAHTYTNAGNYTIKIYAPQTSAPYTLGKTVGNNTTCTFFNLDTSSAKSSTTPALIAIRLGTKCGYLNSKAFQGCTELTTISIPSSVITLGSDFLGGCTKLKNIITAKDITSFIPTLAPINHFVVTGDTVTSITSPSGCTPTLIMLGDYVTSFTEGSLGEPQCIIFGYGITTIKWVGAEHNILQEIHAPDISTWLNASQNDGLYTSSFKGYDLYTRNSLIKNLIIPSDITNVKDYAFSTCTSIESICLPNDLTIGNLSFFCPNLQKLYCYGLPPILGQNSFGENNKLLDNITIYIYDTYESDYKNSQTWGQYSENFSLLTDGDDYTNPYRPSGFIIN